MWRHRSLVRCRREQKVLQVRGTQSGGFRRLNLEAQHTRPLLPGRAPKSREDTSAQKLLVNVHGGRIHDGPTQEQPTCPHSTIRRRAVGCGSATERDGTPDTGHARTNLEDITLLEEARLIGLARCT